MKKKDKQINIRVSEDAKNRIISNAQILGISQSDYFEMIALNGVIELVEINSTEFNSGLEKIISIFEKIGNNINQIAKKANSGENISEKDISNINKAKEQFAITYKFLNAKIERKIIFNNREK